MCSLQLKGLLGDAGFEFSPSSALRPPVALDEEDMRDELRADLAAELDAEDLMLGGLSSAMFRECEELNDPKHAFPTVAAAWPCGIDESDVLQADDAVKTALDRRVESRMPIDLTADEDWDHVVEISVGVSAGKESSAWYINGAKDQEYWAAVQRKYGEAKEDEGAEWLAAMETCTTGLKSPGFSSALLIDASVAAPLGGAAAGQEAADDEDAAAASEHRNADTYITRVGEEEDAVARGEHLKLKRNKRAAALLRRPVLDPTMDDEVLKFDFSTLLTESPESPTARRRGFADVLEEEGSDEAERGYEAEGSAGKERMPRWWNEGADDRPRRTWVDTRPLDVSDFEGLIPQPAITYPFELDVFQKQAVARIERGENVFVAAHTSAGKTVCAEYAIALCQQRGTRVIYTSPIKTLSNQKFRDFKDKFDDVGIITGDVQINGAASCLIMTTEILRSILYTDPDLMSDVECVIFDEVHYVNDSDRGYVWEEVIILLPKRVRLVMLSATVPNTEAFADWVGRVRGAKVNVISTQKRPVPLRHALFFGDKEYAVIDNSIGQAAFSAAKYKEAEAAAAAKKPQKAFTREARLRQEAQEWRSILRFLGKQNRLPCIVFAFSKDKLDALSEHLSTMNYTTKAEKAQIEAFLRHAMKRLKGSDKSIPQVTRLFGLLKRGMAVHHAGLMPLIKEVVETLFCRGLIRVLFATETFAMGVNAPAKCVVFADVTKHDGSGTKRDLLPGEYIQMSGRAGRRGLDTVGHVLIACTGGTVPPPESLKKMMTGTPVTLESKFRLTYTMVLNSLASPLTSIAKLLRNSFAEARANKYHPVYAALRDRYTALLDEQTGELTGDPENVDRMYHAVRQWVEGSKTLLSRAMADSKAAQALLPMGKVVVIETAPMVLTLGYVVRLTGVADATCIVLGNDTSRAYDAASLALPVGTLLDAAAEEVVCPRSRIVAVLTKNVVAAPEPVLPKTLDARKGKGKDDKKGPIMAMPVPRQMVNVNDKKALLERAEKLKDLLRGGLGWADVEEVAKGGSLEGLDLAEDVKVAAAEAASCAGVLGGDMDLVHARRDNERRVAMYARLASDDGLYLMPEFRGRVEVLLHYGMLEAADPTRYDYTLLPKGRCAMAINSMDSVIGTELIFARFFDDLDPPLIAAALSAFVCTENRGCQKMPAELEAVKQRLTGIVAQVYEAQCDSWLNVDLEDYLQGTLNFNIAEAVWEWAYGTPFLTVVESCRAREGTLIRDITRLDGVCREFLKAARSLGDTTLQEKFARCSELIRRDVVFCTSLYLEP
eukprot:TRINITY_DN3054_c0_g1_i1.p1 TRINITY_DN3054_c0_g1~~TRINITY_DN3054_c0_g1_i1.p1  ORF type:complete len:1287 (+),score=519.06 TRINITY_DN3054_c0_g1_i1:82-3942(+)